MAKCRVTPRFGDPIEVEVHEASITKSGALLIAHDNGQIRKLFAPGAWETIEPVQRDSTASPIGG